MKNRFPSIKQSYFSIFVPDTGIHDLITTDQRTTRGQELQRIQTGTNVIVGSGTQYLQGVGTQHNFFLTTDCFNATAQTFAFGRIHDKDFRNGTQRTKSRRVQIVTDANDRPCHMAHTLL